MYSKGKKSINLNDSNYVAEDCFNELGENYKDVSDYLTFLEIINSSDIVEKYNQLKKLSMPLAEKYISKNKEIQKYRTSLNEICGSWSGNDLGYNYYITITINDVSIKRYYDSSEGNRAGELCDSEKFELEYSSDKGWYYTREGKKCIIKKQGSILKFQHYYFWKRTIKCS